MRLRPRAWPAQAPVAIQARIAIQAPGRGRGDRALQAIAAGAARRRLFEIAPPVEPAFAPLMFAPLAFPPSMLTPPAAAMLIVAPSGLMPTRLEPMALRPDPTAVLSPPPIAALRSDPTALLMSVPMRIGEGWRGGPQK